MSRKFKIVKEDDTTDDEDIFSSKKEKKKKSSTFNLLDVVPEEEDKNEVYTIISDVYDGYQDMEFKTPVAAIGYANTVGFDCRIYKNNKPYGMWTSMNGFMRY